MPAAEYAHYGLALQYYTHFTYGQLGGVHAPLVDRRALTVVWAWDGASVSCGRSPIRRYAGLRLVHAARPPRVFAESVRAHNADAVEG